MKGEYLKLETVKTIAELLNENKELRQEIERLNKELENLEKLNNANYQSFIEANNIINELEKWLAKEYISGNYEELYRIGLQDSYDKLQDLKGSEKE